MQDLDSVVFTHLDCDDVAGVDGIQDAKRIYVTREELEKANEGGPRYRRSLWEGTDFTCLPMAADPEAPFQSSCGIYGDGTLTACLVPGHSAGSIVLVARDAPGGPCAILAGDTGYNEESWKNLNLPGPLYNKENMYRSLAFVSSFRLDPKCKSTFAAHDPAVAPGRYEY